MNEAKQQFPGEPPLPDILFSGNFPYEIQGKSVSERLKHINQIFKNWQFDLEIFRELVSHKFLERSLQSPDISSNNLQQDL